MILARESFGKLPRIAQKGLVGPIGRNFAGMRVIFGAL
jgi:hypothetical protein